MHREKERPAEGLRKKSRKQYEDIAARKGERQTLLALVLFLGGRPHTCAKRGASSGTVISLSLSKSLRTCRVQALIMHSLPNGTYYVRLSRQGQPWSMTSVMTFVGACLFGTCSQSGLEQKQVGRFIKETQPHVSLHADWLKMVTCNPVSALCVLDQGRKALTQNAGSLTSNRVLNLLHL